MSMSTQHKLDMVRRPRVQITYDVEIGNAIEMKELPFVMGIIADLSGHPSEGGGLPLKNRKFVEIDNDNFGEIMASIKPRLELSVLDKMANDGRKLNLELEFQSMEDLEPLSVVRQIEPLSELYDSRSLLKDLLTKLDGNDALEDLLRQVMNEPEKLQKLKDELGLSTASEEPAAE